MPVPLALLTWLSPVFPTGGFAYSGGLETAIREGRIVTAADLVERTRLVLAEGSLWNDGVFVACAFEASHDHGALLELAMTAKAFAGSGERLRETCDQGRAFARAVGPWGESSPLPADTPFPVQLGACGAAHRMDLRDILEVFLHSAVSAQLQAAIRLSLIGQTGASTAMAALEADIALAAARAAKADLSDLGTACFAAEIDAMRHAALDGRLFLS